MIEYVLSGVNVVVVVGATLTIRGWVATLRKDHTDKIHDLTKELTGKIHALELLVAKLPSPGASGVLPGPK